MERNVALLNGVSKLFTEKTLEQALTAKFHEKNVSVNGWNFGEASAKGDSYLSTVDRVTIDGNVNGKPVELRVVVKSLPQNLGRRKTFRSTDFFYNEIIFYTKIAPIFRKFLQAKNQQRLFLVPECLAYVLDGENDFIVLDDVNVYGFGPASRQSTLNLDELQLILKGMARFHGVSFAHKDQHEEDFYNAADQLRETYFSDRWWDWYKTFHGVLVSVAKDAISREYPDAPETKKFCTLKSKDLWQLSRNACSRTKTPTSVVNQGDAWAPNFLMRTDEATGEKEALLLDFQLARCSGPVSDLAFFIYSCTDKEMRDKNFDNLLKFYHDEVSSTIEKLGSDPKQVYPRELFLKEVDEEFGHGCNFCLESIPFSMLDENEAFDLDIIRGNEAVNIADVWKLKPIKESSKRRRLADAIIHAIKRGFL